MSDERLDNLEATVRELLKAPSLDRIEARIKELEAVVSAQSNEILRIKNDHYWPHHNGARIDHIGEYVDERFSHINATIDGIVANIEYHEDSDNGFSVRDAIEEELQAIEIEKDED